MKIVSVFIIIFGFSQCKSIKLETNPPFKITKASYENWTGGQPGVRGTNVKIYYTSATEVAFEQVYFRNRVTKLEPRKAIIGKLIIGYFNTSTRQNEVVLDANPAKEINNPVPNITKFPFELNENDAIISYIIKGELKYYKIKSIQKKQSTRIHSIGK